jgi:hypothetical protein
MRWNASLSIVREQSVPNERTLVSDAPPMTGKKNCRFCRGAGQLWNEVKGEMAKCRCVGQIAAPESPPSIQEVLKRYPVTKGLP